MTLWAAREGGNVKVSVTEGAISFSVTEHPENVRGFWALLGRVLEEIDTTPEKEGM